MTFGHALRERKRAEHARMSTQPRRDDVLVDAVLQLRRAHVVVEEVHHALTNGRKELTVRHHPTAHDDPLRRDGADEIDERQRQVPGFEGPAWMGGWQLLGGLQPARRHCRAAGQAFEAIAVEWTRACE